MIFAAEGEWKTPRLRGNMMQTASYTQYIAQRLQTTKPGLRRVHCKAHRGLPGNELVDSISRCTATSKWRPECRQSMKAKRLISHPMLPFLWWTNCTQSIPPPWHQKLTIKDRQDGPKAKTQKVETKEDPRGQMTCLKITCATMNVFASIDNSTVEFYNKRQMFSQQLHERSWSLIGMQETRATRSMSKSDPFYHMMVAEGERGHHGVELWVSKTTKFGSRPIGKQDIHVMVATPTILQVAIRNEEVMFDAMVLHAPQRTSDAKEQWWLKVTKLINDRVTKGIPVIVLGDLNARLGSVQVPGIGPIAKEEECPNGKLLRKCILENDLTAINTTPKHQGDTSTYAKTRIDYILTSTSWMPAVVMSWKDTTVDLMHLKDDHRPVICKMEMLIPKKEGKTEWGFDRKEAFKAGNEKAIQNIFETFEEPKWEESIDTHVQKLEEHIRTKLREAFPSKPKRIPRHPYIGERLWQQVELRKAYSKELEMLKAQEKRDTLQKAFCVWNRRVYRGQDTLRNQYQAVIEQANTKAAKEIKHAIKRDKNQHIEQTIHDLQRACKTNDTRTIFQQLRSFRPRDPRKRIKVAMPLPHLEDDKGPVENKQQWDLGWHNFWAKLECAEVKEWAQHEEDLDQMCAKEGDQDYIAEACQATPTWTDVRSTIQTLKKGKAPGPDGIPSETYAKGGMAAVKIIHTIAMKQLYRQKTPKTHRGGWAFPIYKFKGSQCQRSSYRAIVLQNTLNKTLMRLWRPELARKFGKYASSRQGGARQGTGPQAHILKLRLHQKRAQLRGMSQAIVMVDIESAFYRTLRGLFVNTARTQPSKEHLGEVFRLFGLSPLQADETTEHLQGIPALEAAEVNKAIQAIIEDAFRGNWTRIKHSDTCIIPQTGTRPGDPSADVLFSFVIKRLLDGIENALLTSGHSTQEAQGLAWVDDLAFMIEDSAPRIEGKVKKTLSAIFDESMQRALKPSLQPGKTDILLHYAGQGTQHYKRQKEEEGTGITFQSRDYGEQEAHCVQDAKYLGSIIDARQRLMPDIVYSTTAAYHNVKPLRKQVLANKAIEATKRTWVLQALATSKAAYAAGTWPTLTQHESKVWNARIYKIYRLLEPHGKEGDERANLYLLAKYELPAPDDLLAAQRLRMLSMIARWADEEYLRSVYEVADFEDEQTWPSQVVRDYKRFTGKTVSFREILGSYRGQNGQQEMKKVIAKHHKKMKHIHRQSWQIWQQERKDGKGKGPSQETGEYTCGECGKQFKNATARAVHAWKIHKVHAEAAHFCPTPTCMACGRNFHTLARVRQHVGYSSMRCLEKLKNIYEPLDIQQIQHINSLERDEAKATWKSGRKTLPQIRTYMRNTDTSIDSWAGNWTDYYDQKTWSTSEVQEMQWLQTEVAEALLDYFENLREASEVFLAEVRRIGHKIHSPRVAVVWLDMIWADLKGNEQVTEQMLIRMTEARKAILTPWGPA